MKEEAGMEQVDSLTQFKCQLLYEIFPHTPTPRMGYGPRQACFSHKPGIIEFVSAVPRTEMNIPKALNE